MNESIDERLSDLVIVKVRERLRPETADNCTLRGMNEEGRILFHPCMIRRGVIVDDVQHHFQMQLVSCCHEVTQVLRRSAFRVDLVVVGDTVWRGSGLS